jgi:lambda repressor-like predicted transcriptional regulator
MMIATSFETSGRRRLRDYFQALERCPREIRDLVFELDEAMSAPGATEEDRSQALAAIEDVLFPERVADEAAAVDAWLATLESLSAKRSVRAEGEAFADRVRTEMKKREWTQERLAAETSVGQSAIANVLNRARRPRRATVEKFARAFGIDPKELWPFYTPSDGEIDD